MHILIQDWETNKVYALPLLSPSNFPPECNNTVEEIMALKRNDTVNVW